MSFPQRDWLHNLASVKANGCGDPVSQMRCANQIGTYLAILEASMGAHQKDERLPKCSG